jgi:hypothetical protein
MRLVIDLPEDDDLAAPAVLRRRLLEPGKELQLQGFRAYVVGVVEEGHPGLLDPDGVEGPLWITTIS